MPPPPPAPHASPPASQDPFTAIVPEARQLCARHFDRHNVLRCDKIRAALAAVRRHNAEVSDPTLSITPYQRQRNVPHGQSTHHPRHVVMPCVPRIPPYNVWIPVRKSYAMHALEGAYVPYLGDRDEEGRKAVGVFNRMSDCVDDFSAFDLPSDGELDGAGCFSHPLEEEPHAQPYGILNAAMRAAQRHTVIAITAKYGRDVYVLDALRSALNFPSLQYVRAVLDLARSRANEVKSRQQALHRSERYLKDILKAVHYPQAKTRQKRRPEGVTGITLKHFCFVCQVFCCDLHRAVRLVPRQPIPDQSLQRRIHEIKTNKLKPCSLSCFLLPAREQVAIDDYEHQPWTKQERHLLRELLSLFQRDSCSLALGMNTRKCREVRNLLEDEQQAEWIKTSTNVPVQYQRIYKRNRITADQLDVFQKKTPSVISSWKGTPPNEKLHRDAETAENTSSKHDTKRLGPQVSGTARKTAVARSIPSDGSGEHSASVHFIPCDHEGPCNLNNNCTCYKLSRICQPDCGCNSIRYSEDENSKKIIRAGQECILTQDGCDCVEGRCNDDSCQCFKVNAMACNPEECKCDCRIPPWQIDVRSRRCKNSDIIIRRHKRTYVGRSNVEGYGLFAGDYFEPGDVIGEYVGGQWPNDKVDGVLALGDVIERTYAYDVLNVTLDGTMFGAKIKFVNCGLTKETVNCQPELLCVKGHFHLFLIANTRLKPGTEFLFDYGLNGKKDPEWLRKAKEAAMKKSKKLVVP